MDHATSVRARAQFLIVTAAIACVAWTSTAHAVGHEFLGESQYIAAGSTIKFFSTAFSIPADPLHDGQDLAIWGGIHSGLGVLLQGGAHFGPGNNMVCKGNNNAWTLWTEFAYDSGGGGCGQDAVAYQGDYIEVTIQLTSVLFQLVGNPGAKQYRYVEHWDVRAVDVTQNYATSSFTYTVIRDTNYKPFNAVKLAEEWINPNGNANPIPCLDSVSANLTPISIYATPYSGNSNAWNLVPWDPAHGAPGSGPTYPPNRTTPDNCGYIVDVNGQGGPESLSLTVY